MIEFENLRGYAHVVNGIVVNVSVWDGIQPYDPGDGVEMVPLPYAEEVDKNTGETVRCYSGGIGWDYQDGEFVDNRPTEDDE